MVVHVEQSQALTRRYLDSLSLSSKSFQVQRLGEGIQQSRAELQLLFWSFWLPIKEQNQLQIAGTVERSGEYTAATPTCATRPDGALGNAALEQVAFCKCALWLDQSATTGIVERTAKHLLQATTCRGGCSRWFTLWRRKIDKHRAHDFPFVGGSCLISSKVPFLFSFNVNICYSRGIFPQNAKKSFAFF